MQLRECYNRFKSALKPIYGNEEGATITAMIFEALAQKSRTDIITDPNLTLGKDNLLALEQALLQLKRQVPVQYVIGYAWFAGMKFKVSPDVLIPRPETEELVNEAIIFLKNNNGKKVIDIGTGTGCISISIKKQVPHAVATAMDISKEALNIAAFNAETNDVEINWKEQDFLEEANWKNMAEYDLIISNPPYIPEKEEELLDANVRAHEPGIALFVPDNEALLFYKKIAAFGQEHLAENGGIFMETHESFASQVADHFSAQGYNAAVKKDMFGKDRMVVASRCR